MYVVRKEATNVSCDYATLSAVLRLGFLDFNARRALRFTHTQTSNNEHRRLGGVCGAVCLAHGNDLHFDTVIRVRRWPVPGCAQREKVVRRMFKSSQM